MSVINKMLRDLEGQKQQSKVHKNYQPSGAEKTPLWRMLILIVLLVCALVWSWFTFTDEPRQPVKNRVVPPPARVADLASNDSAPVSIPAQIAVSDIAPVTTRASASLQSVQPAITEDSTPSRPADITQTPDPQQSTATGSKSPVAENNPEEPDTQEARSHKPEASSASTMTVTKAAPKAVEASLRDQINAEMKKGNMREAIRLLTTLSKREPDNINVRKKLASVLFAEGQVDQAQLLLEQTLSNAPANNSVRLMLARLYSQQAMNELAWKVVSEAVTTADAELLGFRGGLAHQQGRYQAAVDDYSTLVALQPDEARWWLGLGIAADKLNRRLIAIEAYQKAIKPGSLHDDVESFIRQRLADLSE